MAKRYSTIINKPIFLDYHGIEIINLNLKFFAEIYTRSILTNSHKHGFLVALNGIKMRCSVTVFFYVYLIKKLCPKLMSIF